jgi:tetratricopeptide (TPR) repeat protein
MLTGPIILGYIGRYDQAIPLLEKAIRLNPVSPISYLTTLAFAYTNKKEYDKAIRLWQEALRRDSDNYYAHIILTAIYQLIGEEKKATQFAEKTIRIKPEISISMLKKRVVMTDEEALNLLLRCTSRRWHPL